MLRSFPFCSELSFQGFRYFHFLNILHLDFQFRSPLLLDMAKKKRSSADTEQGVQKGRKPAPRAKEFSWYGRLREFETGAGEPWWKRIKWEDETRSRKTKRSAKPRHSLASEVHPGFLWEALRRFPEAQKLIHITENLSSDALVGKVVKFEKVKCHNEIAVQVMGEVGFNVLRTLDVLRENWRHPYDQIPNEPKNEWKAHYLELWHQIGQVGSVPTRIPDSQDCEGGVMAGQDKAAFDLLMDEADHFDPQPMSGMFLENFAKLRPTEKYHTKFNSFIPEGADLDSYPWLSFGILKGRLKVLQMHPMALAVDLSKTTDTILRDFKLLIDKKKKALGIVIADRRIRQESFEKIHQLDYDVRTRANHIPLIRTVKGFESSAKLDVSGFLARMEAICDPSPPTGPLQDLR
ncbi:hypothetical protein HZ994_02600 [Akkermansiaceae bacterium]|nr:hypothetical protein HZ994_02600 [Akkermansiaceae bacterium]